MKYRDVLRVLNDNGFSPKAHRSRGSHQQYQGSHSGREWVVTLAFSQPGEDVDRRILASIIRQSGLDKRLFR